MSAARGATASGQFTLCIVVWSVLVALQFGLLTFAQYAWGFNFWQYLPPAAPWILALSSLALCFALVRRAVLSVGSWISAARPRVASRWVVTGAVLVGVGALWLLRERELFGDSAIFLFALGSGWGFVFPDIGGTFLMRSAMQIARSHSLDPIAAVQLMSCICGPVTALYVSRLGERLAPGRGALTALLILSGGSIRIFAGHVEAYGPLLVALAAYLWLSVEHMRGRHTWTAPCLMLGCAIWIHLSALLLLPSLLWLLLRTRAPRPASRSLARAAAGVAIAALPSLGFLLFFVFAGQTDDLYRAGARALEILGRSTSGEAARWWVLGWNSQPTAATDYVLFSLPHLKYLINAFYVLAPFALPVLLAFLLITPRLLVATPTARFLGAASLPLVAYACLLRPFWGPFDWDLFSATALCLSALAAHLLAVSRPDAAFRQTAVWLIGFQVFFVSLPFLWMGIATVRNAGPFVQGLFDPSIATPGVPPADAIAPWL